MFFILSLVKNGQERLLLENLDIISRGKLLADMSDQWLDDSKNAYEEHLIDALQPQLKTYYETQELKTLLDLTRIILDIDPFNDIALKYQLKGLRKLKGIEHAHKIYDLFTAEYKRSFGTDYQTAFEKIIQ